LDRLLMNLHASSTTAERPDTSAGAEQHPSATTGGCLASASSADTASEGVREGSRDEGLQRACFLKGLCGGHGRAPAMRRTFPGRSKVADPDMMLHSIANDVKAGNGCLNGFMDMQPTRQTHGGKFCSLYFLMETDTSDHGTIRMARNCTFVELNGKRGAS
jgi:hypothetical protein